MDTENLEWVRTKAANKEEPLSALLNKLVGAARRREAHSRESIAEGLARWRAEFPERDGTLLEDMAKVRAMTNGDIDP